MCIFGCRSKQKCSRTVRAQKHEWEAELLTSKAAHEKVISRRWHYCAVMLRPMVTQSPANFAVPTHEAAALPLTQQQREVPSAAWCLGAQQQENLQALCTLVPLEQARLMPGCLPAAWLPKPQKTPDWKPWCRLRSRSMMPAGARLRGARRL